MAGKTKKKKFATLYRTMCGTNVVLGLAFKGVFTKMDGLCGIDAICVCYAYGRWGLYDQRHVYHTCPNFLELKFCETLFLKGF